MLASGRKVKRFPQDHTDEQVGEGALKVPVKSSDTPIITQTSPLPAQEPGFQGDMKGTPRR